MSRIFISHSSKDEAEAIALKDWLVAQGWGDDEDIFLDLDPQRGLVGGERWKEALRRNIKRCEAVVFVITPAWRASEWCLAEYQLAESFHKPIFGVITKRFKLTDLPGNMAADWQVVNLTRSGEQKKFSVTAVTDGKTHDVSFNSAELMRLKAGLVNTGVDPRYFEWPPQGELDRPPYLGLRALQKEDAGIFFGRDGQIVEALDCLRGLHDGPPPRMLVILGASGAGKSSFMRAGVLPRLERDDRHFTVLNPVRPGEGPLTGDTGLIASIEAEAKLSGLSLSRNDITKTVMRAVADNADGNANAGTTTAAEPLKELLRSIAASRSSEDTASTTSIVLPVDQMEELYFAGGDKGNHEAEQFRALLTELTTCEDLRLIVLATIRSDSYEHIQFDQVLGSVDHQTMSLPPIPQGSYSEIIRGPIRRLVNTDTPLKIDDQLVGELLKDIAEGGAKDALPLLAFTLERLYTEYTRDNTLRLSDYEDMGRIRGSIEKAVEQAFANADATIVADHDQRLKLLRHGLIPWLARVDPETSEPMRRIAPYTSIPEISRPLIDLLVEQRLLSTDTRLIKGNNGQPTGETEVTIEPTHEALLRQWGRLEKWLDEDKELLSALDAVKQASREWDANNKQAVWLAHMSGRLETALSAASQEHFANFLDPLDTNYLQVCTTEDNKRRNAEIEAQQKIATRTKALSVAFVSIALLVVGAILLYLQTLDTERRNLKSIAERDSHTAYKLSRLGRFKEAMKVAKSASADLPVEDWPPQLILAVHNSLRNLERFKPIKIGKVSELVDLEGIVVAITEDAKIFDVSTASDVGSILEIKSNGFRPSQFSKNYQGGEIYWVTADGVYGVLELNKRLLVKIGKIADRETHFLTATGEIVSEKSIPVEEDGSNIPDFTRIVSILDVATGVSRHVETEDGRAFGIARVGGRTYLGSELARNGVSPFTADTVLFEEKNNKFRRVDNPQKYEKIWSRLLLSACLGGKRVVGPATQNFEDADIPRAGMSDCKIRHGELIVFQNPDHGSRQSLILDTELSDKPLLRVAEILGSSTSDAKILQGLDSVTSLMEQDVSFFSDEVVPFRSTPVIARSLPTDGSELNLAISVGQFLFIHRRTPSQTKAFRVPSQLSDLAALSNGSLVVLDESGLLSLFSMETASFEGVSTDEMHPSVCIGDGKVIQKGVEQVEFYSNGAIVYPDGSSSTFSQVFPDANCLSFSRDRSRFVSYLNVRTNLDDRESTKVVFHDWADLISGKNDFSSNLKLNLSNFISNIALNSESHDIVVSYQDSGAEILSSRDGEYISQRKFYDGRSINGVEISSDENWYIKSVDTEGGENALAYVQTMNGDYVLGAIDAYIESNPYFSKDGRHIINWKVDEELFGDDEIHPYVVMALPQVDELAKKLENWRAEAH